MANEKLNKVLLKLNDDVTTIAETSAKAADDAAAALAVANKAAQALKEAQKTAIDANEYALQARNDIAAIRASTRQAEQGVNASVEAVEVATASVKEVKASINVTKTSAVEAQAAAAAAKVAAKDAESKATAAQIAVEGLKTTIDNFNKAGGSASGQQIGATPKDVADAKALADSAKTEAALAKTEATSAVAKAEALKVSITAAKTEATEAKEAAASATAEATAAKTKAEKVLAEFATAKKEATDAAAAARTAAESIETSKTEITTAKTEITAAKELITKSATESAEVKKTAEAAKTTAETAKSEATSAKEDAAAAKTAAEEAKKIAEAKTGVEVTAAVEDGVLKINNQSTGVELVTKESVDEKVKDGVGTALGSPDLPAKMLDERNKDKKNQSLIKPKIAVENGIFYIEDALPDDLRAKVLNRHYDDKKNINRDDALKIVQAIQAWYDNLPSNVTISSIGGVFPLVKNKGYKPEYYGADNRRLTKNRNYPTTVVCHGQQPCISFMKSKGNKFDFSRSKFILEDMGQDAFHLCNDSVDNVIIHGGTIVTRAYMKLGYVGGLQGLFAPIDGWTPEKPHIGTGCADKGTAEAGFNTTTNTFELSMLMNNSYEAQDFQQPEGMNKTKLMELLLLESSRRYTSKGGYWDANGESAFPQEDGTTSKKWGTWRGQQRGCRGYGWRLFGTRNTIVENFDVRGMTGGAIVCGLYGTPSGDSVDARDSAAAFAAGIVAVNTKITGGYFTHNYICGVEAIRASGFEVTGIYAPDSVVGHPDASLEHTRGINGVVSLDPGYQQCTSRYLPMDNIYIHDNVFGLGHRKVMDIHTGNNVRLHNNSGKAMYYGISTVIEEIFSGKLLDPDNPGTSKDVADTQSFPYEDSNIEVRGNHITSGMYGLHPINGARGVKARRDAGKWWLRCHQVWMDNVVYAPRGLQCNFGHNHYVIENNQFTFALPYGEFYGLNGVSALTLTNGGSGYTSEPKVIIEGGGEQAFGAFARAVVKDGVVTELKLQGAGSRFTEIPTVRFEGGGGTGAAATAAINTHTYAMLVGSEPHYGEILGSVISKNFARNSPEGNYARQFVFGRLTCSSITCNYADITPYTSLTKSKKYKGAPYTSDTMKYRDGLLSAAFYNGGFKMCEVFGNYEHNQLTQVNKAWIGLTRDGSIHTDYEETMYSAHLANQSIKKLTESVTALQNEVKALKAAKPAETTAPPTTQPPAATPANPAPTQPSGGNAAATPAPATPAPAQPTEGNQAASGAKSAVFDFTNVAADASEVESNGIKLKTLINVTRLGEPQGWTGAFKEVSGKKAMVTGFSAGKGTRYIETEGFASVEGKDAYVIIPFKPFEGGSDSSAYSVLAMNGTAAVDAGLVITNEASGCKMRGVSGATVNNKIPVINDVLAYDKWYVAAIKIPSGIAFDKVRIGTNQNTNTSRIMAIGAGSEFVIGATAEEVAAKVKALMTAYEITA